jgi:hypothetical protein
VGQNVAFPAPEPFSLGGRIPIKPFLLISQRPGIEACEELFSTHTVALFELGAVYLIGREPPLSQVQVGRNALRNEGGDFVLCIPFGNVV